MIVYFQNYGLVEVVEDYDDKTDEAITREELFVVGDSLGIKEVIDFDFDSDSEYIVVELDDECMAFLPKQIVAKESLDLMRREMHFQWCKDWKEEGGVFSLAFPEARLEWGKRWQRELDKK